MALLRNFATNLQSTKSDSNSSVSDWLSSEYNDLQPSYFGNSFFQSNYGSSKAAVKADSPVVKKRSTPTVTGRCDGNVRSSSRVPVRPAVAVQSSSLAGKRGGNTGASSRVPVRPAAPVQSGSLAGRRDGNVGSSSRVPVRSAAGVQNSSLAGKRDGNAGSSSRVPVRPAVAVQNSSLAGKRNGNVGSSSRVPVRPVAVQPSVSSVGRRDGLVQNIKCPTSSNRIVPASAGSRFVPESSAKVTYGHRANLPNRDAVPAKEMPPLTVHGEHMSSGPRQPRRPANGGPVRDATETVVLAEVNAQRDSDGSTNSRANEFGSTSSTMSPRFDHGDGNGDGKSLAKKGSAPKPIRQPLKCPAVTRIPQKSTARKPAKDHGDAFEHLWAASDDAFKFTPVLQSKVEKKRQILDIYKPTACTPAPKLKSSSYINRQAKLRETERINNIIVKKLLNVKSTILKV